MRVLHVIGGIAPRYGGPSTAVLAMCQGLARLPDVAVEIVTTDADGLAARLSRQNLPQTSVPIRLFPCDLPTRWHFSARLAKWLWQNAECYDLLHVHGIWSFSTLAACLPARRRHLRTILMPHGMLSPHSLRYSVWKKRLYWSLIERSNLRAVQCFHTTSQAEAHEVRDMGLTAPAEIIPLGVEEDAWKVEPRPNRLAALCQGRAGDRPVLLFLSRLHPKKGVVDVLLPALARMRTEAFLAIVGGSDEHALYYEALVRQAIDRLGLSSRVELLGPVEPRERWTLFDGASVLVLPSHHENFGIVVAEAMARGLPVVVSEAVQASEHVAAANAGRVVPLSADALAENLDEILADPKQLSEMGQRGLRYVREHLSWPAIARRIARMYHSLVENGKPTGPS